MSFIIMIWIIWAGISKFRIYSRISHKIWDRKRNYILETWFSDGYSSKLSWCQYLGWVSSKLLSSSIENAFVIVWNHAESLRVLTFHFLPTNLTHTGVIKNVKTCGTLQENGDKAAAEKEVAVEVKAEPMETETSEQPAADADVKQEPLPG